MSYTEFYDLVTDPDPGRPDFGKPGVADEKVEAKKNAGDQMQRQRELEKREEKRKMLATFVDENNVGVAEIQSAIEETAAMPAEQRKKGVDFGQFCKFNKVEPTGEYHRLFSLFDPYGKGTIDMKELALGMLNFVDLSKEEKTDLVFRIFDEDSSGLLTADELGNVLAANHMQSLDAVKKKAETIMRQADRDGNGELSLDEFRIVAQKCKHHLSILRRSFLGSITIDTSGCLSSSKIRTPLAPFSATSSLDCAITDPFSFVSLRQLFARPSRSSKHTFSGF